MERRKELFKKLKESPTNIMQFRSVFVVSCIVGHRLQFVSFDRDFHS